ncbi:MAG: ATPase [Chloroflexota bacterium]
MLVDRLEAVINSGWRAPMTGKVCVDEQEVLDVLDLMRTTIPDEIKQARRVNQEREKILAQAQTEGGRIVSQAQERSDRMVAEDSIHRQADERGREIVEEARREADEIHRGADDYAFEMLERLEHELQRISGGVHNALSAMNNQVPAGHIDEDEE